MATISDEELNFSDEPHNEATRPPEEQKQPAEQDGKVKKLRKPRVTFKPHHLMSDRGIPRLLHEFDKIKWKGKGHEAADLCRLMQLYREWARTLFPKLPFDTFLQRVSKMGKDRDMKKWINERREDYLMDERAHKRQLREMDEVIAEENNRMDDSGIKTTHNNDSTGSEDAHVRTRSNEREEELTSQRAFESNQPLTNLDMEEDEDIQLMMQEMEESSRRQQQIPQQSSEMMDEHDDLDVMAGDIEDAARHSQQPRQQRHLPTSSQHASEQEPTSVLREEDTQHLRAEQLPTEERHDENHPSAGSPEVENRDLIDEDDLVFV